MDVAVAVTVKVSVTVLVRVANEVPLGVAVTVLVKAAVDVELGVTACDTIGVAVETAGPDGAKGCVSLFLHPTIKTAGSSIKAVKKPTNLFNFSPNFYENQSIS